MAYNMKVCKATGVTPLLAYFGREAKLPADMVLRLPDTKYQSVLANVQAILEQYQSVFDTIQQQEDETSPQLMPFGLQKQTQRCLRLPVMTPPPR